MLSREDLWSLEEYARKRNLFREEVVAHKRKRQVVLGEYARLLFEDRLTVRYQIQEMLRIEQLVSPEQIQAELDAYNPLIPDGSNWKATFMLEYPDLTERRRKMEELAGVERAVWLEVAGQPRVYAMPDEGRDWDDEMRFSSVHFLRFELTARMITAVREGYAISAGINHPALQVVVCPVDEEVRRSLAKDLCGHK